MAKQISNMKMLRKSAKYDWPNWSNGKVWEVKRGSDFQVHPEQFRTGVYLEAKKRGMKATTSVKGNAVFLQFNKIK